MSVLEGLLDTKESGLGSFSLHPVLGGQSRLHK